MKDFTISLSEKAHDLSRGMIAKDVDKDKDKEIMEIS